MVDGMSQWHQFVSWRLSTSSYQYITLIIFFSEYCTHIELSLPHLKYTSLFLFILQCIRTNGRPTTTNGRQEMEKNIVMITHQLQVRDQAFLRFSFSFNFFKVINRFFPWNTKIFRFITFWCERERSKSTDWLIRQEMCKHKYTFFLLLFLFYFKITHLGY